MACQVAVYTHFALTNVICMCRICNYQRQRSVYNEREIQEAKENKIKVKIKKKDT